MTATERKNPDLLKASRKKRIAAGAGVSVELVNRLLKQHRQMADMMKAMGQNKRGGPMAGLANMFGLGGGMPSPDEIAAMQKQMGGGQGLPEFPGAAKAPAGLPLAGSAPKLPGLPGLGVKPTLPGLGSFNPFGGKKK
jgi:signal recognition particle subunit SRP54